jgi:hypothetical protein
MTRRPMTTNEPKLEAQMGAAKISSFAILNSLFIGQSGFLIPPSLIEEREH